MGSGDHRDRGNLWILSRTPALNEAIYQRIIQSLELQGFDPDRSSGLRCRFLLRHHFEKQLNSSWVEVRASLFS